MNRADKKLKAIAIIPALNEEKNIGSVLLQLKSIESKIDIVVIDDGSTDRTAEVASNLGVAVVTLPFNLGIGGAVQTGFKYALRKGYDIAIQVDADGQHNPLEIEKLIKPIVQGKADVVIGSRYISEGEYKTPGLRRLGMVIFSKVNSLIVRKEITDNTSGFRAYNRKAIEFLSQNYPSDFPEAEAVVILGRNHFKLLEIPVNMRHRQFGQSTITSLKSIYYMLKVSLAIFVDVFKKRDRKEVG